MSGMLLGAEVSMCWVRRGSFQLGRERAGAGGRRGGRGGGWARRGRGGGRREGVVGGMVVVCVVWGWSVEGSLALRGPGKILRRAEFLVEGWCAARTVVVSGKGTML